MLRRSLDRLYMFSGVLSALCILSICLVVSAQVFLNLLAKVGGYALTFSIPSYVEFAGFSFASASFLALASTLRSGGHVRVSLIISKLHPRARWGVELATLALGAAVSAYATWYSVLLVHESFLFNDVSSGSVRIPLWIPQLPMAFGLALLTVAFVDFLVSGLVAGTSVIAEEGAE